MACSSRWARVLALSTILVAGVAVADAGTPADPACQSASCCVTGEYVSQTKKGLEILLFSVKNNNREAMQFVKEKHADVDAVQKGATVVAVFRIKGQKSMLSALHRAPTVDPDGATTKDEPIGVAQLSRSESISIPEEISRYNKDAKNTHGSHDRFVRLMSLYPSVRGTVTSVRGQKSDQSVYLYRFYIDPLPGDEKASEGGFLIDLATSIEVDLKRNTCVEVYYEVEEIQGKKAVAVFGCPEQQNPNPAVNFFLSITKSPSAEFFGLKIGNWNLRNRMQAEGITVGLSMPDIGTKETIPFQLYAHQCKRSRVGFCPRDL